MKIKVGSKELTIRKWKGKDKKKFINALKYEDLDENTIMNSLVYDCMEEDVILSNDEFMYALSRIRAHTLGENFSVEFYCHECTELHKETFLLKDIISFSYTELNEIKSKNHNIKIGDIKNKEVYLERILEDEIYDMLLRVEQFNGNDAFTLDGLVDLFDDIDVDELDDIMTQFNDAKFIIDDVNIVTCPNCDNETLYKFDELPGFFPDSWFSAE